ncbi:MAG TPA: 2-phospho-L-lactate transferase [Acidimicrobiia bacterium]|nr:2-phospho-L-lactate transferase [Acidimicrobiia bacterium]
MKKVVLLSGGVGGARMARGLAALDDIDLTVVVNVGDDEVVYGLHVSPDLDTVVYTLAGVEGPEGWGLTADTFTVMKRLSLFGTDTRFRIGDRDLATHLFRTQELLAGATLSDVTARTAAALGVPGTILPATEDTLRTMIKTAGGEWLSFQEYFVMRRHEDEVADLRFEGAATAAPAPAVVAAIEAAEAVIIGPSNPPLSIWPILAIRDIASAIEAADRVMAVSPLIGGRALKGPADRVMASLGLPGGNAGVVAAYGALLNDLVIHTGDANERAELGKLGVKIHVGDTRIADPTAAWSFAEWLVDLL